MTPAIHAHYWLIDPPVMGVSQGRCKLCGAIKVFRAPFIDVGYTEYQRRGTLAAAEWRRMQEMAES